MALLFERPFKIGDWLKIGDTLGQVVEITWRSVHLQTKSNNIVIVPNSALARQSLTNYNRPFSIYRIELALRFSYNDPPSKVKQIITQTALDTEGVFSEPPPFVLTSNYDDFTINYQVFFYVTDHSQELRVRDRFMTRICYVAKRYNLYIPYPIATEIGYQGPITTPEMLYSKAKETLMTIPSLSQFGSDTLNTLTQKGTWLDFAKGEYVINEGEPLLGLYLIIEGTAEISLIDKIGQKQVIGQLEQGELFGEKALLISTQMSDFSILAVENLQVLLLDKNLLQTLLEHSPRLSQEIGEIMELRRRAVKSVLNAV